ncbi:heterokaryon incompatibility protein-domain-containing protein, partial [Clohesyomyces aquaticus]
MMSIYSPLPDDHIRIIELQPGERDDSLVCNLIPVSTQPWPDYETISDVWGDPNITRPICCNSESLPITRNLGHALRALRHHNRCRRLWADAICINQRDLRERDQRVRLMHWVYANAQQVVNWLGLDNGSAKVAAEFIASVSKAYWSYAWDKESWGEGLVIKSFKSNRVSWDALADILDRALLERVWVIQELGRALKAMLRCSDIEIPWENLTRTAALLGLHCRVTSQSLNARFAHVMLIERMFLMYNHIGNHFG